MSLKGLRILLVEDEAIIAMTTEDMLEDLGCESVVTAATLPGALAAIERAEFDVVLLDINLNGLESLPVADRLRAAGRPYVFTTGYGAGPEGHEAPTVAKPYQPAELEAAIRGVLRR